MPDNQYLKPYSTLTVKMDEATNFVLMGRPDICRRCMGWTCDGCQATVHITIENTPTGFQPIKAVALAPIPITSGKTPTEALTNAARLSSAGEHAGTPSQGVPEIGGKAGGDLEYVGSEMTADEVSQLHFLIREYGPEHLVLHVLFTLKTEFRDSFLAGCIKKVPQYEKLYQDTYQATVAFLNTKRGGRSIFD